MNPRTNDPTKLWYDILKADMKEKDKYCQKHFGCKYSECTEKQKSQCNRECGKEVKKADDKPPKQIRDSSPDAVNILEMDKEGKKKKKKKGGSMPDLSGDGKVTMKDVLIGRGVVPKGSDTKKSEQKNVTCSDCNSDSGGCPSCSEKQKEIAKMLLAKAMPCPICGAGPGDGPMDCAAGEPPVACSRRINAMRQIRKPRSKDNKMRVPRRMR